VSKLKLYRPHGWNFDFPAALTDGKDTANSDSDSPAIRAASASVAALPLPVMPESKGRYRNPYAAVSSAKEFLCATTPLPIDKPGRGGRDGGDGTGRAVDLFDLTRQAMGQPFSTHFTWPVAVRPDTSEPVDGDVRVGVMLHSPLPNRVRPFLLTGGWDATVTVVDPVTGSGTALTLPVDARVFDLMNAYEAKTGGTAAAGVMPSGPPPVHQPTRMAPVVNWIDRYGMQPSQFLWETVPPACAATKTAADSPPQQPPGPSDTTKWSLRAVPNPTVHSFSVFVKTLTGKTLTLKVTNTDSVEQIKALVERSEGITPCQQRIIFGGFQLQDEDVLWRKGLWVDATAFLVLQLRGS
jgi:hypothetical protein